MTIDYYRVLEIAPWADRQTIETAYRRKAVECHPDRGGSKRDMQLVNAAWEVLSNPERRSAYDESRQQFQVSDDPLDSARSEPESSPAADQCRWGDKVRSIVERDFIRAEFNIEPQHWLDFPDAGASASGWVFVLAGSILGIGIVAFVSALIPGLSTSDRIGMWMVGLGVVLAGSKFAATLHRRLGRAIQANRR